MKRHLIGAIGMFASLAPPPMIDATRDPYREQWSGKPRLVDRDTKPRRETRDEKRARKKRAKASQRRNRR